MSFGLDSVIHQMFGLIGATRVVHHFDLGGDAQDVERREESLPFQEIIMTSMDEE
jgi:hypothetical protein